VFHSSSSEALRLTEARLLCYVLLIVGVELAVMLAVNSVHPVDTDLDLVIFDEYGPRRLVCGEGGRTTGTREQSPWRIIVVANRGG